MSDEVTPFFYGKVVSGQWHFKNRKLFDDHIFHLDDDDYQLSIKRKFKRRTTGQLDEETNWNGYYWGVIIQILHMEMNLSMMDCHEELKLMHNPKGYTVVLPDGTNKRREYGGSTKSMSNKRFIDYCTAIRTWAMHPDDGMNVYIPEPHESPEATQSMMEGYRNYKVD